MRGKHEIISDYLSGVQTWLKGKVQASCQDATSLLTTMTNKAQTLTNDAGVGAVLTLKGAQFTRITEVTYENVTGEHCIQTGVVSCDYPCPPPTGHSNHARTVHR
jgi:hypothetical protein